MTVRQSALLDRVRRFGRPVFFFVLQQSAILLSGIACLRILGALTGHTVHGAASAVGPAEGAAILLMYAVHLGLTVGIFRWAKGTREALGLRPSWRRAKQFAVGALAAFILFGAPWLAGLAMGRAHVADSVGEHRDASSTLQVSFWLVALVVNSFVEEAMSRAFPMRLFSDRSLLFRVLMPSLVFAALHLADEGFSASALASRTMIAVPLGLAYAATDDIWLAAGIHTGVNYAIIWRSGAWHAGSLVLLAGEPIASDDVAAVGCAVLAIGAHHLWRRSRGGETIGARNDALQRTR